MREIRTAGSARGDGYKGATPRPVSTHHKMGESGVHGVLKSLSFPVMKKIYAERPLSEDEMTALSALFKDAAAKKQVPSDPYPLAGLGFFALCIVGVILFKRSVK